MSLVDMHMNGSAFVKLIPKLWCSFKRRAGRAPRPNVWEKSPRTHDSDVPDTDSICVSSKAGNA